MVDGFAVDIGGEDLHLESLFQFLHAFPKQHGNGIGFLAGGTAGDPDTNSRSCSLAREKPRDDLFLNLLENLGIPEETGDADEEFAKERVPFAPGELHIAEIVFQPIDLVDGHTPLDAAYDGAPFVLGKVMTGLGAEQDKDLFQPVSRLRSLREDRTEGSPKRVAD